MNQLLKLFIIGAMGLLLIGGCAGSRYTPSGYLTEPAEHYLQLAATATPPERQFQQLNAVRRFLQDQMPDEAQQVLNTISTWNVPQDITNQKQLLQARIYLVENRPYPALTILSTLSNNQSLDQQTQIELYRASAKAYAKTGNIIRSVQQRIWLDTLLSDENDRYQNALATWDTLQRLSPQALYNLLQHSSSPTLRGWIELAYIAQQPVANSATFTDQLKTWQHLYPKHAGNTVLPRSLTANTAASMPDRPHHITLLLPLQGKYGKSGQAVRNGFLAAYYYDKQQGQPVPTIQVLDTSQSDIHSLYVQAVNSGADFIVGPLTKQNVQSLSEEHSLPIPVLALNTSNNGNRRDNLYQFGLSPQDEAEQAAQRAWRDGHFKAIVLTPEGDWGNTIGKAFTERWQTLGGNVVSTFTYPNQQSDLSQSIQQMLNINESQQRANALQDILKESFKFVPRRRQDIDMIFLVALPEQARQIRPLLKFYYAGDIPTYTTSIVYTGRPNPRLDRDLDGILFCDMPWVLDKPSALSPNLRAIQQHIMSLWGNSFNSFTKLYALGTDAYNLTTSLNRLIIFPHFGIDGATGVLYLDKDQHIYRQLQWAQIRQGNPLLLNNNQYDS